MEHKADSFNVRLHMINTWFELPFAPRFTHIAWIVGTAPTEAVCASVERFAPRTRTRPLFDSTIFFVSLSRSWLRRIVEPVTKCRQSSIFPRTPPCFSGFRCFEDGGLSARYDVTSCVLETCDAREAHIGGDTCEMRSIWLSETCYRKGRTKLIAIVCLESFGYRRFRQCKKDKDSCLTPSGNWSSEHCITQYRVYPSTFLLTKTHERLCCGALTMLLDFRMVAVKVQVERTDIRE